MKKVSSLPVSLISVASTLLLASQAGAFSTTPRRTKSFPLVRPGGCVALHLSSSENNSNDNIDDILQDSSSETTAEWQSDARGSNPNTWRATEDEFIPETQDWQTRLEGKQDGSFWSAFELPPEEELQVREDEAESASEDYLVDEAEVWLSTLASISAEEVEFNMVEADRADKAREMAEWGFDQETIKNTFGIAVDDELEKDEVEGMQNFRDESYWEDEDWKIVESHTKVEKDPDTGEPVRQQMVYVDEHTCIGCTNCAMVAQSTFFMDDEHGRARVFQQWGDDDETIQVAIETCPVNCIHYVPYDELVKLEKERRNQNINFKARLVSQAENGNSLSHRVGGPNAFTAPQKISGNMGSRCNNCPSRGCRDCPMFGIGKNPEFERKEKERLERRERRRLQQLREEQQKSADL